MEGLAMNAAFWAGKRVLVTGHTGFKGSWLSTWLQMIGAHVSGFALDPGREQDLFNVAGAGGGMDSQYGDVRDFRRVQEHFAHSRPEIVIHLAAQSLVRPSYANPVDTYATNVMGTVHMLEAARKCPSVRVVVNVTSDKCYENREWIWGYRENEAMGGRDPYSSSKGCAELVTSAYRDSFFRDGGATRVGLASARAGNVIGGGDWASDRLVPDMVRAARDGRPVLIRNPAAVRPWQHVLEPLYGYLLLAEKLWFDPAKYSGGWNFGPSSVDVRSVEWVADRLVRLWGQNASWALDAGAHPHEAHLLSLDSSKSRTGLGWQPRRTLQSGLAATVAWYQAMLRNEDMQAFTRSQINEYMSLGPAGAGEPQTMKTASPEGAQ